MTRTSRFDITFAIPGMPFDGNTPYTASLGGSETAGWAMAKALVARKHRVRVFSNTLPGTPPGMRVIDNVVYFPLDQYTGYKLGSPHDLCVIQRQPDAFNAKTAAKLNWLWCHDLPSGRQANGFRSILWNVDKVVVVSDFMKKEYDKVYNLAETDLVWATRNGIFLKDFELEGNGDLPLPIVRDRFKMVYAARPERGLDVLIDRIVPKLFEDERVTLSLVTYANPVEHLAPFYQMLAAKCAPYGDRIKFVGNLNKRDLYALYKSCGVLTYPTPSPVMKGFSEVSCISAMEAQACGLPIVTSNRGAFSETMDPNAGVLIDGDPMSDEYRDAFCSAVYTYMTEATTHTLAGAAGKARAETLDWSHVAEAWENEIEASLSRYNSDPVRLAHHLYRRNDIMPLKHLLKREAAKPGSGVAMKAATALAIEVNRHYGFVKSPQEFRRHYARGGEETTKRLRSLPMAEFANNFQVSDEVRFHKIEAILGKVEAEEILDYGCGHGWMTIYMHNKVGRKWLGVDVDPGAVTWAGRFAEAHGKTPADLVFKQGDHRRLAELIGHPVDAAICSEVLEHCPDPREVAEAVERAVKLGGRVIFTVPYGPSEYGTPNWATFRNHIWEFQVEDLYDLWDGKKDLTINVTQDHFNEVTNDAVGFYTIQFSANHEPLGEIDIERHLKYQRPRETLSAVMMVGDLHEPLLDWTLTSIEDIADEIVIADCGMTIETLAIAAKHPKVRVVPSLSPLIDGFEKPRNDGLAAAQGDWVLWIDSDEKLINGRDLVKYLRQSMWHGLSIKQHHFAVDSSWTPDMPVRCFRRGPCTAKGELFGKTMRFWGCIHEHPELVMNDGPGPVLVVPDVHIAHAGYLNETVRKRKFMRNHPLLLKDQERYPERVLQKFFIMRDNMLLSLYEMQMNGGAVTGQMRDRAREVVELYRKYFLGKPMFVNIDAMPYYRQALEFLGEGIEVAFHFAANRDGVGDQLNGAGDRMRFGSAEEAIVDLSRRMRDRIEPLTKDAW